MEIVTVNCMDGELKVFKNLADQLSSLNNYGSTKGEIMEKIQNIRDNGCRLSQSSSPIETSSPIESPQPGFRSIMPHSVIYIKGTDMSICSMGLSGPIKEYFDIKGYENRCIVVYIRNNKMGDTHYIDRIFADIATKYSSKCKFLVYDRPVEDCNTGLFRNWFGNMFIRDKDGKRHDLPNIIGAPPQSGGIINDTVFQKINQEIRSTIDLLI